MFSGTLDELPDLKIGLAHGGGFLPYQIGRLVHGHKVRSETRATEMRQWAERLDVTVRIAAWDDAEQALYAPLVVNTTPAGVTDTLARAVPERPTALFDVLYDPWPTVLAARWSAYGGAVVSGLDLLVHQAAAQVELMTGVERAPLAVMRAAGEAELAVRASAG